MQAQVTNMFWTAIVGSEQHRCSLSIRSDLYTLIRVLYRTRINVSKLLNCHQRHLVTICFLKPTVSPII